MLSLIDLTGLGVRTAQSSTGYAGWGQYDVGASKLFLTGSVGRGRTAGSGGSSLIEGGMDSR